MEQSYWLQVPCLVKESGGACFQVPVGRRTLRDEQILEASYSEVMGSTVPFLVVLLMQRSIFCDLGGTRVMLMISEECEWACPFHMPYSLTGDIFTHV